MISDINNNDLVTAEEDRIAIRDPTRSDGLQKIISRQPGFLERWSLAIFLLIILSILLSTWFVRYPDILQAAAMLTAANAPKEIVNRQDGKLVKLFVKNDDDVANGQAIGWIESTSNHPEALLLSSILDSAMQFLKENETEKISGLFAEEFQNLGDLQIFYQQFVLSLAQFNDYLVNGYNYKRKQVLFEDLNYLKRMAGTIDSEKNLTQQQISLLQESFDADDSLFKEKVISKQDLRDQKSRLVDKKLILPQLELSSLTNGNQQTAKQKEIDELEHAISQQKSIFQQALQTLKSLVDEWKRKYILTSPIAGRIVFSGPLQENQFIQVNKIIGYVIPKNPRYYAQVILQQNSFGKVYLGQKVELRFDAYPFQEFGSVQGKINYISNIPSDSGFLGTVELPNGLVTNYNKKIQYRNGLKSQALIITRDQRLLQRFYYAVSNQIER